MLSVKPHQESQLFLALLQDRASELGKKFEFCRSTLALVYDVMFPRNPQPQGLPALMDKFKNGEEIHRAVRIQLVASAKVAFSWVHIHQPISMRFRRVFLILQVVDLFPWLHIMRFLEDQF
jgi:hypothetical protein